MTDDPIRHSGPDADDPFEQAEPARRRHACWHRHNARRPGIKNEREISFSDLSPADALDLLTNHGVDAGGCPEPARRRHDDRTLYARLREALRSPLPRWRLDEPPEA